MSSYLFQIDLLPFDEEMMAKIPRHRRHIDRMFADGIMLSYSVSARRDTIWCVLEASDEAEAMERVAAFPLYDHFADVTCNLLMFHNIVPAGLPGIVLN